MAAIHYAGPLELVRKREVCKRCMKLDWKNLLRLLEKDKMCHPAGISHSCSRSIINIGSGGGGSCICVADSSAGANRWCDCSSTAVVTKPLAHIYQLLLVIFMLLILTAVAVCVE